mgnify:CR=1 FL=1
MSEKVTYDVKDNGLTKYLTKSFIWVAAGLVVTALTAFLTLYTGLYQVIFSNWIALVLVTVLELGVVIIFSSRITKMSVGSAYACFFAYAALTGVTFSVYGLIYETSTIYLAFGFTALLFINMAIIGFFAKKDLSRFSSLFMAGLITLIVFSLLNVFWLHLEVLDTILCYAGIVLFLGITAWDVQKIKTNYYSTEGDISMMKKANIYGALTLYLDFINIFIRILQLLGRNRSNN